MESVIRKWGNSPAVRLPAAALKAAGYRVDDRVKVSVEPGRIVIEPLDRNAYTLDALLDGITAENVHGEEDFGPRVGREAL